MTSPDAIIEGLTIYRRPLFEVAYTATQIQLLIDDVVQITVVTPIDFAGDVPLNADWGHLPAGSQQMDAVFGPP